MSRGFGILSAVAALTIFAAVPTRAQSARASAQGEPVQFKTADGVTI